MRRLLIGVLGATLFVLGLSGVTPVLAHDGPLAPASSDDNFDRNARSEAAQLTEELRTAATRPTKLPTIQAAVASQAERRRALVNRLAASNPAAVLDLALSPAERAALPSNVRTLVEERVDLDGELQVLHIDYEDGHSTYDAKLVKGSQETPLKLGAPLGQAKPGDQVRMNGVALAGNATVVTDQVIVIQSPTSVGTTGIQRTAVILVLGPGASSHPYANKTNTASIFFRADNPLSARSYYSEVSYGQVTIVGGNGEEGSEADVIGPVSVTSPVCGTGSSSTTTRNQALAAADPLINYSTYDRVVLSIADLTCGSGGIGSIRTQSVGTYDGASQRLSISWNFNNAMGSTSLNGKIGGVALHEYGHNIGVWHANSLECGTVSIGSGTCASDEYGDPSDVMGSSSGYGHFNGVHKDILGWIGTRAQVATTAGSYTLLPYETDAVETKVLKVPRTRDASGNVNGYYYLEYRKPTASWNGFLSNRPDFGNGVLVHTSGATPLCAAVCNPDFSGAGGGGDSNIIDTQPGSVAGSTDFRDAPLVQGESYVDAGAGVTITVGATTAGSATVDLTYTSPLRSIQTVVYPEGAGTVSGAGSFPVGQSVTLTASPAGCFVRWRENRANQSYPNPYTFTVGADRTLEAVFNDASCWPAPANDTFPGATVSGGQQTVNTSSATVQSGEPTSFTCDGLGVSVGRTAWYTITPAATSQITLATAGSSFDTVLRVYNGSAVNGLTAVTCNDDVDGGTTSRVQFTAQAGTAYRVQVGGYNSEGGNAVLNITSTVAESDPRQEGPIQVSSGLVVGGTATISVTVKNYGTVPTPAIRPYVDGTNGLGQSWRSDGSAPASAVIQPGQSQTFTLQQPLSTIGAWTTTGVFLWNTTTNVLWKSLPANGHNQQVSFAVAAICSPRPKVSLQTAVTGDGRLSVTLTAGSSETGNRLTTLQFGGDARTPNTNALIDVPNIGNGRTAPTTVTIPNNPPSYTFYVRRQTAGVPVTLPVTVTDACGPWQTVVGGGVGAGF